jgi:pimeloyl-ACP methyl ester carboxylesterase
MNSSTTLSPGSTATSTTQPGSWFANDASLTIWISLTLLLVGAGLACGIWWGRRRSAKLAAEAALKSPELDLDMRLGQLRRTEIHIDEQNIGLAWREIGHGPSILCLHGIGASMLIWRRFVPLLAGQFRTVCVDWPGFGNSDKPTSLSYGLDQQSKALELFLEREFSRMTPPLVLASSMGGAIALHLAARRPELIRGLIAIAPATDPQRIPRLFLPLSRWGQHLARLHSMRLVQQIVNLVMARRELITPELVALYHRPFREDSRCGAAFFKALHLLADPRMPTSFMNLPVPLLIIRGDRDTLVRNESMKTLATLNPQARVVNHPAAGHHVMEDEPEWLADQTQHFMQQLN